MGFIDRISRNNAKERMISEKLKAYKFSDRVKGKPLNIVSGNFTVPLENRIMAYAGIPEYIQRAKLVDEKIIKIKADLKMRYEKLEKKFGNKQVKFNKSWEDILNCYNFQEVNELIIKHNLLYHQEANLRMDFETGEYLLGSNIWEKTPPVMRIINTGGFTFQIDSVMSRGNNL